MVERAPKLLLQIVQNRLALLSLELQEEKVRVTRQIALVVAGAMLGVTGLVGIGILLAFLVPTSQRALVGSMIVAVFITAAVVLLIVARGLSRRHTPFEATLAALEKDTYKT